jgi:hypothetical protein
MKTIDLVYVNAGGGHRSAATALQMAIREQGRDWTVRLVNFFEVLDPQDVFRRTTGVKPEDYYNVRLERGWTLGLAQELRILGVVLDSFKAIRAGVVRVTEHAALYRAGVKRIRNRAVFEIPEILEQILAAPVRVDVDVIQHFRAAERLHLS